MNAKIYGAMLCLGMFALVGLTFSASVARGSEVIHNGGEGYDTYYTESMDIEYILYDNPDGPDDGWIAEYFVDWGEDPSFGAFAYAGMGYTMDKTTYPGGEWSAHVEEVASVTENLTKGCDVVEHEQLIYDTSGTDRYRTLEVFYEYKIPCEYESYTYEITTTYDTGPGGPL